MQIIVTLFLLYWPIVLLTSVMAFDAPGSNDNQKNVIVALVIIFYPVFFGITYFLLSVRFWGLSPLAFLGATVLVPLLGAFLMGYPKLLLNSIRGVSSNGYFSKEGAVYFDGNKIEVDSKTFQILNTKFKLYARDQKHVFFRGRIIKMADPETFKAVEEGNDNYYIDKKNVFYDGIILEGADSKEFKRLTTVDNKGTSFFKDQNFVYFNARKIAGLSGLTAKSLLGGYLSDGNNIFYYTTKISSADVPTFHVRSDNEDYASDKNSVYYLGVAIPLAQPNGFQILDRQYAKDAKNVFFTQNDGKSFVVERANLKKFIVTNYDPKTDSDATDETHYFLSGHIKP